jgi:UDP-2,3-diacylglucosamine pyrophosphatase LpxH
MPQDKDLTRKKLSALWQQDELQVLDTEGKKYVIFSDVHLGDGGGADDFRDNEKTLEAALDHYAQQGYSLILLGDIEEFWQFDFDKIVNRYQKTIYEKIRAFGDDRVHRIFGNHDIEWGTLVDPAKNHPVTSACASEALKLRDIRGDIRILLVHGHQGSEESDKHSWFSRFFVRLFRGVEPFARGIGLYDHPSATKSQIMKDYEKLLYSWAKEAGVILISGHSHRAIFASKSYVEQLQEKIAALRAEVLSDRRLGRKKVQAKLTEINTLEQKLEDERQKGRDIEPVEPQGEPVPCYFNTGCALYSDGITTIEIDHDKIRLVKWHKDSAMAPRFQIYQEGSLSSFIETLTAG